MNVFERLDGTLALKDEERMILESVRTLAREQIAPRAEHYDRSAQFPWDNVKAINQLGLNAMFIPEAYGGAPLSYAAYLACVREISKACASKAAVGAITRCLAVEWAAKGIRVLDVAPGYIETELNAESMKGPLRAFLESRIPGKRPGTAAEVARLVASLFAEDNAFLTGETIYLDGGQGMAH